MISTKELLKHANQPTPKKDNRKRTDCEAKPYIKTRNMDAYDLFKQMEKEDIMVDAIITDPPYNISRENNFTMLGNRTGIDFGDWDKDFDIIGWIKPACSRLKKGGSIIIFSCWKNIGDIANELEAQGLDIKDLIRWEKTNPMPRNITRRYITDFELAVWATKGKDWTFNWDKGGGGLDVFYRRPQYLAPIVMGKERIHPTQKSLKVMTGIILTHTNPGDTVLDPFFGSGTTAVACQNNQRNFIGSEINPEYFTKAVDRINNGRNK